MDFSIKIKQARNKRGLTQEQLAEKAGITQNYLGIIERGVKLPKLTTFIRIANALQVSSDYLLADELDVSEEIRATYLENAIARLSKSEQQRAFDVLEVLTREY